MKRYIKSIQINNVRHLRDLKITIPDDEHPHLFITGKNGSGKTSLLQAISQHIDKLSKKSDTTFLQFGNWIKDAKNELNSSSDPIKEAEIKNKLQRYQRYYDELFGQVQVDFEDLTKLVYQSDETPFITAMYAADRKVAMIAPTNPTKPNLNNIGSIGQNVSDQFLYYLSDLKIQEALARNEGHVDDADRIRNWFDSFEKLLKRIFDDQELELTFDYKDYSFWIKSEGKNFQFTQLSDGFAAILDIVSDLILKMSAHRADTVHLYNLPGIVLIDEVETHLHLSLQRQVMPILTEIFPNIQFVVSTHSPLVLNSIHDATVYDLEHQEVLTDLSDYSYEALAEGYFDVSTRSSYLEQQLGHLRTILEKNEPDIKDRFEAGQLIQDFEKIPEAVSPRIIGEYEQLKVQYHSKIESLKSDDQSL